MRRIFKHSPNVDILGDIRTSYPYPMLYDFPHLLRKHLRLPEANDSNPSRRYERYIYHIFMPKARHRMGLVLTSPCATIDVVTILRTVVRDGLSFEET